MPYAALPDRRIPYDNDGSVVAQGDDFSGCIAWASNATMIAWQSTSYLNSYAGPGYVYYSSQMTVFCFFPEQREVSGMSNRIRNDLGTYYYYSSVSGSQDSVNGLDGTWETASLPSGNANFTTAYYWRSNIKPVSFTGPKRVVRGHVTTGETRGKTMNLMHWYGEKGAGETPDDIIYINHDDTPGVEYTAPEDFGDQPLGTTVVRQFRLKNTSGTKTANTINIQCNDTDFAISEDGVNWVVTINIASLSAGAESATLYVRSTTPAVGSSIGPRFARIVTTVGSYT
jgi:hypothetical protein